MTICNPLTGYEPHQLDNFDYSEAFAAIFQEESVDIDTELSYSCDAELDDELIGKAASSPLFIQEREPATNKCGETRVRTKFKFVSKTEIKSRNGKRKNQDSP